MDHLLHLHLFLQRAGTYKFQQASLNLFGSLLFFSTSLLHKVPPSLIGSFEEVTSWSIVIQLKLLAVYGS